MEQCTPDPYCFDVAGFLENHSINRTCSSGSDPLNIWGECADNSTLDCYNGYRIPDGMPRTAFPVKAFAFCYSNRSVDSFPEVMNPFKLTEPEIF